MGLGVDPISKPRTDYDYPVSILAGKRSLPVYTIKHTWPGSPAAASEIQAPKDSNYPLLYNLTQTWKAHGESRSENDPQMVGKTQIYVSVNRRVLYIDWLD